MIALLFTITAMAWDGDRLYVARPGGVDVYRDGKKIGALGDEKRAVMALAASGRRVVEGGGRAGERGEVRIWDEGRLVRTIRVHDDLVYRVVWGDEGKTIYTAGGDKRVGRIDAETGNVEYLEGHTGPVLALAARGGLVVSGGSDRTIRVWKSGKLVRTINNHWDAVHALAFSPDGTYLASGSADRTVRIWQPDIGRLVRIVRDHEGVVLDLAWSERALASACSDGKVRLIAPDDARVEKVLEGHADWVNALCPAGPRLYSADASGALREWK